MSRYLSVFSTFLPWTLGSKFSSAQQPKLPTAPSTPDSPAQPSTLGSELDFLPAVSYLKVPTTSRPTLSHPMPRIQGGPYANAIDAPFNHNNARTPSPDPDSGRISPTFAQFAYLDAAVRKTRNRAYQKSGLNDGEEEGYPVGPVEPAQNGVAFAGSACQARPNKRKPASSSQHGHTPAAKSHKKKTVERAPMMENEEDVGQDTIALAMRHRPLRSQRQQQAASEPQPMSIDGESLTIDQQAEDAEPQSEDEEAITKREIEKRKNILYGYPISLLTSPTRNWMPILDKDSLIYQGIQEVMTSCGLSNAVPMLARRLSWIGKGKVAHQRLNRNKQGKFTRTKDKEKGKSSALIATSISNGDYIDPEEWNIDEERKRLLGGIINLETIIAGINLARSASPVKHSAVSHPNEFVDVDIPIHVLLAGTESIAFTDLGFYCIYVPEKNHPFPLRESPNKPTKLNWDLSASRVDLNAFRSQPPWTVKFIGYEWETVRTELLDEDDSAEDDEKEWITTASGYRLLRNKDDQPIYISGSGGGSGGSRAQDELIVSAHPWGREMIESPPVGVYSSRASYEEVVANWFPFAWELIKEVNGEEIPDSSFRKTAKRKAAVEAGKKVKDGSTPNAVKGKAKTQGNSHQSHWEEGDSAMLEDGGVNQKVLATPGSTRKRAGGAVDFSVRGGLKKARI